MEFIKQHNISNQLGISEICLGTMRFIEKKLDQNDVLNLIDTCFDYGIDTHHCSYEYESYQLYRKGYLSSENKSKIKHVVKLPCPHFDELKFSGEKLKSLVNRYLNDLEKEKIEIIQWLVRSQPINDADRLKILQEQTQEIEESIKYLKKQGYIAAFYSFPYSVPFANKVLEKINSLDGIIAYLNLKEKDYLEFAKNNNFISIRPLAAGKVDVSSKQKLQKALAYPLKFKGTLSTIISLNSIKNIEDLIEALNYKNILNK